MEKCLYRFLWRVPAQSKKENEQLWPGSDQLGSSSLSSQLPASIASEHYNGHFTAIAMQRKPTDGLELENKQLHGTNFIKESKVYTNKTEPETYLARIKYFPFVLETFMEC